MFHRILVSIDGSPTSNRGLEEAIGLASDQKRRICLLHVIDELVATGGVDAMMYVPPSYTDDSFGRCAKEEKNFSPAPRQESARPASRSNRSCWKQSATGSPT